MNTEQSRDYLEQLKEKEYAKETIQQHKFILKQFKNTGFTKLSIQRYQHQIRGLKPGTQHTYLTILKKILHLYHPQLEKHVVLPRQPKVFLQNIPEQITVKETLQKPDITRFKGVRDRVILELLYATGIRRKELVNLKLTDIDMVKGIVRVQQGKGKKDRLVPVARQSIAWLKKYLKKVRPQLKPRCSYLLVSQTGHQMGIGTPAKIIHKYSRHSPHKYRHAYATHLLQNGMKETSLQQLLGHASVGTTQIYTRVTTEELKASYARYHKRETFSDVAG